MHSTLFVKDIKCKFTARLARRWLYQYEMGAGSSVFNSANVWQQPRVVKIAVNIGAH